MLLLLARFEVFDQLGAAHHFLAAAFGTGSTRSDGLIGLEADRICPAIRHRYKRIIRHHGATIHAILMMSTIFRVHGRGGLATAPTAPKDIGEEVLDVEGKACHLLCVRNR